MVDRIIAAYCAQIYDCSLPDISVVLVYGIVAIITIAFIWAMTSMLLDFIRPIMCRDFDAAVSLREDLLDLQFLHFPLKAEKTTKG